jgi:uncharacterized protein (DUF433 family)
MNWSGCDFVERVPGRMGGVPVVVGSRVTPESLVEHAEDGFTAGQIAWMFSLPRGMVRGVLDFARQSRAEAA